MASRFERVAIVAAALLLWQASAAAQTGAQGQRRQKPIVENFPTPLPQGLRDWMRYEQGNMDPQIVELNKQDPDFAPHKQKIFKLRSFWVDADKTQAFLADSIEPELREFFTRQKNGKTQVRILVHPESNPVYRGFEKAAGAEAGEPVVATATSSSRTVLVQTPGGVPQYFFAKLSLNKNVGKVLRTIAREEAARSVGTTNVLDAERAELPRGFEYFRESIGIMPKYTDGDGNEMVRGGMIVRAIPKDVVSGQTRLMPLFALYNPGSDGSPPPLAQMIRKSGMPARQFVRERIVAPFASQWFDLAIERGIVMEPHGQNVLLEVGRDGLPTGRFFHRDFGGFMIDFKYRSQLGIRRPSNLPTATGDWRADYWQERKTRALDATIGRFFHRNFLYELDKQVPGWFKNGWLDGVPTKYGMFTADLIKELEGQYKNFAGHRYKLKGRLKTIPGMILSGRKLHRGRVNAQAQQPRRGGDTRLGGKMRLPPGKRVLRQRGAPSHPQRNRARTAARRGRAH